MGLLTVVLLVFVNATKNDTNRINLGVNVGDNVPAFNLKNVDGKMIAMSDYKDAKGFILVFTCNTCPFSKMYEQRIDQLNLKYASQGYPVLAINSNDKEKQPGDSF